MSEVEVVAVGDSSVEALQHEGSVWVVVRRVCDALGLNADNQRVKLAAKPWARTAIITVRDRAGRAQDAFCVELSSLPMWLATIDHARVDDRVVKQLVCFQREAHDVLARHFGVARANPCNPPVTTSGATRRLDASTSSGAAMVPAKPSGGMSPALQQLALMQSMLDTLRTNAERLDAIDAAVVAAEARDAELAKRIDDTSAAVATLAREGKVTRESRRRRDAAIKAITLAVRRWCGATGTDFKRVYSDLRSDLGLRSGDGKPIPSLGKLNLRGDQILRLARRATWWGVPGVMQRDIELILDGDDDVARPGAITVEPEGVIQ